ncbi:MAG: hypothetical protein GQ469_03635 [Methanosarcinales archaeon]|nr:hypothetical protein [Methanosarcinales archaeon]
MNHHGWLHPANLTGSGGRASISNNYSPHPGYSKPRDWLLVRRTGGQQVKCS